ncbi:MAG: sensor histidine kinase [Blastomonas fulva]|uniref:sensor histidine kinase n=1 Tax=Blastomonas fulva TaxID=1550728 RepID=UPI00403451C0
MSASRHSLRGRIVLTIIGSVIATSAIFGLAAFGIAYTTEDRLFRDVLAEEVAHQTAAWRRSGTLATPANPDVTIYRQDQPLPPDIRKDFAANPRQSEFYGRKGRHYHVQRFDPADGRSGAGQTPAVAVIEVSQDLLVRPYRDSIIVLLAGLSLVIAAVMAAFGWWLVNRAMKPLSALAHDVARAESAIPILHAGDYPANEIGTLAEALEQAFARIGGFVERERAFTRDASHELRTPLAVISGAAEVIALNRDLPSDLAEPLRRIETATTDMVLALDQLLALARENEGVRKERVALRAMIDKAVSWARLRYPGSLIEVATGIDSAAAVLAHPISLQLVLNNLIGNCFQHVGTGQLVIGYENGSLSISDDGPGFEPGTDPFARFEKGDRSSGSGLGLDITRRLCDAAGIGLVVGEAGDSRKGAHFRLELGAPLGHGPR